MELISRFDLAKARKAHGGTILASAVLPEGLHSPFDHAWGYLNGPGAMEVHKHHKEEVYIFTKGSGFVVVDGTRYPVSPGDVAYIPPDALHSVVNEAEGVLEWAAFWWDIIAPRERNGSPDKEEKHDECDVFNDR
ncbi:MAG: cupin domain-containing protein [Clostridia bacterium]|jgi:Mannose-6-phosphate isomerase|nr:cupin domain-containing protein [Clostridia bacterium]MBQ4452157.1 cupin domain-containing protein [Clostridia bacterium]MBR5380843.1 cupin domain-containing protein [Clostridia bacterium]